MPVIKFVPLPLEVYDENYKKNQIILPSPRFSQTFSPNISKRFTILFNFARN